MLWVRSCEPQSECWMWKCCVILIFKSTLILENCQNLSMSVQNNGRMSGLFLATVKSIFVSIRTRLCELTVCWPLIPSISSVKSLNRIFCCQFLTLMRVHWYCIRNFFWYLLACKLDFHMYQRHISGTSPPDTWFSNSFRRTSYYRSSGF